MFFGGFFLSVVLFFAKGGAPLAKVVTSFCYIGEYKSKCNLSSDPGPWFPAALYRKENHNQKSRVIGQGHISTHSDNKLRQIHYLLF